MKANLSVEDKKMLNAICRHSMFLLSGHCGGQVPMHDIGFIYSILPTLDRYHTDPEKHKEALMCHTTYFNMT